MLGWLKRRRLREEYRRRLYNAYLFQKQMDAMKLTDRFNNNEDRKLEQIKKEPNSN